MSFWSLLKSKKITKNLKQNKANSTEELQKSKPSNKNLERTKDFKDSKESRRAIKMNTHLITNTFKSKERNSRLQVKKTNR